MKNINVYILTAIVSLVMVVATAFLMTAADEPIRQAGYYLRRLQGRSAGDELRGAQGPSRRPRRRVTTGAAFVFLPNAFFKRSTDTQKRVRTLLFPDRRQEPLRKSLSAPRRRIPSRPPSNRKLRDRRGSAAENALAQTRLLTYGRLRECARS